MPSQVRHYSRYDIPLRVVLYQRDGRWFAHCLELDVAGDGETPQEALELLKGAVNVQVEEFFESGDLENLIVQPDPLVQQMFYAGHDAETLRANLLIEPFQFTRDRDRVRLGETRIYEGDPASG